MVSVRVFSVSIVIMVLVLCGIYFFSFVYEEGETVDGMMNNNSFWDSLSEDDSDSLINECDISFEKCRVDLMGAMSGADVSVTEKAFFSNFSNAHEYFELNKGESQETLRNELSSFNSGDVEDLFPIVLYSVVLEGSGGSRELVIICNSFGDLEDYSKNWLLC